MSVLKHKAQLAHFRGEGPDRVAVYPALKNRTRKADPHHPEEAVRLVLYNEMQERFKYPADLIEIEFPVLIREDEDPRYADIVVFEDAAHKRPFIVVECKKPNRQDGEKQGQRYATILRAVYVLWSNGTDRSASVIVNRYPEDAEPISDIPDYLGSPQYKIDKLQVFKDDKQITDCFKDCHSLIRNLSHLKPDDAFTEFLKLLLVKFQDEKRGKDFEFQILLRGQPPKQEVSNISAQRIRQLFKLATEEDADVAAAFDQGDDIGLTNDCIAQIVKKLQRFSFAETSIDQKGRAFESFLSGDMRQELKEFMTPRPVIEAIVQMAQPERQTAILDPCCGSGAFLVYALTYVRKGIEEGSYGAKHRDKLAYDYAHDKLWGFDTSKQMTAVARINMLVNEDGRAHIYKFDSLSPKTAAHEPIRNRLVNLVLTNPPFGKRISAPSSLLEHFEMTKDERGRVRTKTSFLTEALFLERNLDWLTPGGYMFIVLPDSVLGNSQLDAARRHVETRARITAVVSLSSDTFGPSGAKTKTSVLILEKRNKPVENGEIEADHPLFVAHVAHVGYDFTGRASDKNDLPAMVEDYLNYKANRSLAHSFCRVITREQLGALWVAQPHVDARVETDEGGSTLSELCEAIFCGKTAPRKDYTETGFHMVKVGNLTGRGIEFDAVERQYVSKTFQTRHPQAVLKKNDILITAAAHGPKWIGLKVDIFTGAPDHIDSTVMVCGELMVIRLRKDAGIESYALLLFLRSGAGYDAIQQCIRGQSGHLYPEQVRAIQIPNLNICDQQQLQQAVKQTKAALDGKRRVAIANHEAEALGAKLFPSDRKKPIIAL